VDIERDGASLEEFPKLHKFWKERDRVREGRVERSMPVQIYGLEAGKRTVLAQSVQVCEVRLNIFMHMLRQLYSQVLDALGEMTR
jgi:hypothetical protein